MTLAYCPEVQRMHMRYEACRKNGREGVIRRKKKYGVVRSCIQESESGMKRSKLMVDN